jgi:hypothetical protein
MLAVAARHRSAPPPPAAAALMPARPLPAFAFRASFHVFRSHSPSSVFPPSILVPAGSPPSHPVQPPAHTPSSLPQHLPIMGPEMQENPGIPDRTWVRLAKTPSTHLRALPCPRRGGASKRHGSLSRRPRRAAAPRVQCRLNKNITIRQTKPHLNRLTLVCPRPAPPCALRCFRRGPPTPRGRPPSSILALGPPLPRKKSESYKVIKVLANPLPIFTESHLSVTKSVPHVSHLCHPVSPPPAARFDIRRAVLDGSAFVFAILHPRPRPPRPRAKKSHP